MHRISACIISAVLLLTACKIEQTPREFIDRRRPASADRDAVTEELRVRLVALAQALNRGDADAAVQALGPAPDVYLIGLGEEGQGSGVAPMLAALRELVGEQPVDAAVRDVQTVLGPRGDVGWFAAHLEISGLPDRPTPETVRVTGVFLRAEGEWRLVQAHWSLPVLAPTPPANPPPDSAAPE